MPSETKAEGGVLHAALVEELLAQLLEVIPAVDPNWKARALIGQLADLARAPEHLFRFELREWAVIACSGERGQVIARSQSTMAADQYLLRFKGADGRAREEWWSSEALAKPEPEGVMTMLRPEAC